MQVRGHLIRGMMGVVDTKMTKTVGEHWVCAAIARYGWAPALTRDGLERTDVLAVGTHLAHRPMIEIQVKTASERGEGTSWPVGTKAQSFAVSDNEWFVFVLLPKIPQVPRTFVVPRDHVSAAAWISHEDWRTNPSALPGTRNAGVDRARVGLSAWKGYEDRWDLLNSPTTEAPVLLPPPFYELALGERVGLPPGHPWNSHLPKW